VNKRDMVGKIALGAEITRAQAARALEALLNGIQSSLARGDRVTLSGFGSFGVAHRKARRILNPRSGGEMQVQAKRVPRFAPGADLKTAVQSRREPLPHRDAS
jgi:DNA-binding protein HU-beta